MKTMKLIIPVAAGLLFAAQAAAQSDIEAVERERAQAEVERAVLELESAGISRLELHVRQLLLFRLVAGQGDGILVDIDPDYPPFWDQRGNFEGQKPRAGSHVQDETTRQVRPNGEAVQDMPSDHVRGLAHCGQIERPIPVNQHRDEGQ